MNSYKAQLPTLKMKSVILGLCVLAFCTAHPISINTNLGQVNGYTKTVNGRQIQVYLGMYLIHNE